MCAVRLGDFDRCDHHYAFIRMRVGPLARTAVCCRTANFRDSHNDAVYRLAAKYDLNTFNFIHELLAMQLRHF